MNVWKVSCWFGSTGVMAAPLSAPQVVHAAFVYQPLLGRLPISPDYLVLKPQFEGSVV